MQQVIDACTAALAKQPDNPDYLTWRGVAYVHLGEYAPAIADYDAALQIRPSLVLLKNRGVAYADWGKPQEALRDLREYLRQAEVLSKPPLDDIEHVRARIEALQAES